MCGLGRPPVGKDEPDCRHLRPVERIPHGNVELQPLARPNGRTVGLDPGGEAFAAEVDLLDGEECAVQLRETTSLLLQIVEEAVVDLSRRPVPADAQVRA